MLSFNEQIKILHICQTVCAITCDCIGICKDAKMFFFCFISYAFYLFDQYFLYYKCIDVYRIIVWRHMIYLKVCLRPHTDEEKHAILIYCAYKNHFAKLTLIFIILTTFTIFDF